MAATIPPDVSLTLTIGPELDVEQLVVDTTEVLVTTVETPLLLSLGVVQGEAGYVGPPGPPGDAATCDAGSTATSPPGSFAKVTNVGSKSAAIFDFEIPQGIQGPQGNPGTGSGIVSADAGNTAVIGSDTYIYVPHDATKLALAGGTMTGPLTLAADPTATAQASTKNYVDVSIADLNDVYVRWVPFTGPPQSFLAQDLTRDGDWTMVANKNTSDRPAPQPIGTEEDLLPAWTPASLNARATYTVYNEWTLNQSGWLDQYGIDILAQNVSALHSVTLTVNGTVKDHVSFTPNGPEVFWINITPLLVVSGAVVRVTLQVTIVANNLMYWLQQTGLFATAPSYCSLAVGSKDGAAAGTTAYGCHVIFIPGAASPDWDIVAYGGTASPGSGTAPPLADTTQDGLLRKVSGSATDYVGGDNACHALPAGLLAIRVFTASGTYTPTAGMTKCIIECVGGGGAGGGLTGIANDYFFAGGGGAGGYSRKLATAAQIGSSQAVTIGTPGGANAGSDGGNGGTSSVGSLCTANGGEGGKSANNLSTPGNGGSAGTGDLACSGAPGIGGLFATAAVFGAFGGGGSSMFGGGAVSQTCSSGSWVGGLNALGYGGGGGGGGSMNYASGAISGGGGGSGLVVITEYA